MMKLSKYLLAGVCVLSSLVVYGLSKEMLALVRELPPIWCPSSGAKDGTALMDDTGALWMCYSGEWRVLTEDDLRLMRELRNDE